jgi:hypothetical protein
LKSGNYHDNVSLMKEELISQSQIQAAIDEIVNWFQQEWTLPGKLPPFELDTEGHPIGTMDLITDAADYLPLLYVVGAKDYVQEQVSLILQTFYQKQMIVTPRLRRGFLSWIKRSNPFYSTDFLLGLVILHKLEPDLVSVEDLNSITRVILKTYLRDGWMSKEVVFPLGITKYPKWRLPISESNSLLFVEILVEIYRQTQEKEFLIAAERLLECWWEHPFAKQWGVVPQLSICCQLWKKIRRFSNREGIALLYKHNAAMIYGLLGLCRISDINDKWQTMIFKFADSLKKRFIGDSGEVYYRWEDNQGQAAENTLGNSIIIAVFLDLYELFHRKQELDISIRIANYYLRNQRIETGLVANSVEDDSSDMDRQTDFAVNLHHLYSLTDDIRYFEAASRITKGQMNYHRTRKGYINTVNVSTGEVINSKIETRYSSLFLKSLLCLKNGKEVWNDPNLRWVLKDR